MAEYEDTSLEAWYEKDTNLTNYLNYEQSKLLYTEFGYEPISACMGIFQVNNSAGDLITKYYPIWDLTHLGDGMYPALQLHDAFDFFLIKHKLLLTFAPMNYAQIDFINPSKGKVIPVVFYLDEDGEYKHYSEHPRISPAKYMEISDELFEQSNNSDGSIDDYMHRAVDLAIKFLQTIKTKKFV